MNFEALVDEVKETSKFDDTEIVDDKVKFDDTEIVDDKVKFDDTEIVDDKVKFDVSEHMSENPLLLLSVFFFNSVIIYGSLYHHYGTMTFDMFMVTLVIVTLINMSCTYLSQGNKN